jgi:hypothetical protein
MRSLNDRPRPSGLRTTAISGRFGRGALTAAGFAAGRFTAVVALRAAGFAVAAGFLAAVLTTWADLAADLAGFVTAVVLAGFLSGFGRVVTAMFSAGGRPTFTATASWSRDCDDDGETTGMYAGGDTLKTAPNGGPGA